MAAKLADWSNILDLVDGDIEVQGEAIRNPPEEYLERSDLDPRQRPGGVDLAIVGPRCNQRVVEWIPSSISPALMSLIHVLRTSPCPKRRRCVPEIVVFVQATGPAHS